MKPQTTEDVTNQTVAVEDLLDHYADRANQQLNERLPQDTVSPKTLHRAMRYSVLGGGKRIRPVLLYATGEALGPMPSASSG